VLDPVYAPSVRWFVSIALIAGCSFEHGLSSARDASLAIDAAVDTPIDSAVAKFCPTDPHLRLCLSFDQDPLPASVPNEGAATVSASLASVTRIEHLGGGAAELTASSIIHVPTATDVTNIQSVEISFRADVAPANNFGRIGILDSNVIPPNISLFLYRVDPSYQLRCGLGGALITFDAPTVQLTNWYRVLCTCNANTLQLFVDGVKLGETANSNCSSGGEIVAAGMTIGSNNNGGPTGVDEWLIGAVDNVRLWDSTQLQ
jgi:hypothetical protein